MIAISLSELNRSIDGKPTGRTGDPQAGFVWGPVGILVGVAFIVNSIHVAVLAHRMEEEEEEEEEDDVSGR